MLDMKTPIRFFMGSSTPVGFFSFLDDYYDCGDGWRAYLLKGGPGTGKTKLLRCIYQFMDERGQEIQAIICPANPDSLDGLVFPEIKACVLDANTPHAIEPKCWGAVEQLVNLSACINSSKIYHRASEILEAESQCKTLETRCRKFLGAAASLLNDSRRIAFEATDTNKIQRNAARIAARELGTYRDTKGKETRRFLSAITPEGNVIFHETLQSLCPRIYSIEDEYGASSRLLVNEIRLRALDSGYDVISCYCPIFPNDKPDHLLIPSIGIGFTTSNLWHKADFPVYRRIHSARFTDTEKLRQRRQIMSFNRRAARELINEAAVITSEIGGIRRRLEQIYSDAMDFDGLNILAEWIISELKGIIGDS
jgi:hypothetical protein